MSSSIFTITASSDIAPIDYKGHGKVAFTVTNVGGRAIRGRAKVISQDPKQSAWIKIEGEPERDFSAKGTQQFTVSVNVPKDEKAGKYTFRFDVVSVELPDEEYTRGPTIGYSALPPPLQQKPAFPLWLIPVLAVLVLTVGGLSIWLVTRPKQSALQPQATSTPRSEAAATVSPGAVTYAQPITNQSVMLINAQTGKCLTIAGGRSTDNNVPALQFDCDSDPSRTWRIRPAGQRID
jgi:hypothetical protein